jgi:Uma2 family endonuclease
MASLLAPLAPSSIPSRKKWTLAECDRAGDVVDLRRFELIQGELVQKISKKGPHIRSGMQVLIRLQRIFGPARVIPEPTVPISFGRSITSAPEPDIAVLNCSFLDLDGERPSSSQLVLAIEISDKTLQHDLTVKRDLYARPGIPEYWVADVRAQRLIVHREPVNGEYRSITTLSLNDKVSPAAAPKSSIRVSDLF